MNDEKNIPEEEPKNSSSKSTEENSDPTEQNMESVTEAELPTTNPVRPGHPGGHKLQTPAMEVHQPHHLTHKKKWTEYLLEFFMLFLAVFLGFMAEISGREL